MKEQGANLARNAVLAAGWPQEIGGVSLNRFCSSGLQAVNFAAMGVASGAQQLVVAGGAESMSRHGLGSDGAGQDGRNEKLRERVFQVPQGISADLIATLEGFTRAELDELALRSQRNAAIAMEDARVADDEIGRLLDLKHHDGHEEEAHAHRRADYDARSRTCRLPNRVRSAR